MPSTPVGLEEHLIPDDNFYSSSVLDANALPHLARLNEMRYPLGWCSSGATASEWLRVSLDKQYTLTHIALQSVIGGGHDVTALTVKFEKTQEGENWMTYSKLVDGTETSKVMPPKNVRSAQICHSFFVICFLLVCLFCCCCCCCFCCPLSSLLFFSSDHFVTLASSLLFSSLLVAYRLLLCFSLFFPLPFQSVFFYLLVMFCL